MTELSRLFEIIHKNASKKPAISAVDKSSSGMVSGI